LLIPTAEDPMRISHLVSLTSIALAACATSVPSSSPIVVRWEGRDLSELIAAIGPYDTTSVKGDWRTYDWFRFGNCHLNARTSLDDRIQKVELEGMGLGCNVYLEKLGG
jgi:hypothetical protein